MKLPQFVDMIVKSETADENWIVQFDFIDLSETEVETVVSMKGKVWEYINLKSVNNAMNTTLNHIMLSLLFVASRACNLKYSKRQRGTWSWLTMLIPEDYPQIFRGLTKKSKLFAHPEDCQLDDKSIKPSLFYINLTR